MKKYLILYAVLVTAALVVALRHFRSENRRLVQNQEALASDLTHYRTRVLRLRCAEFERLRTEDAAEIRRLGIRLRRLEATAKIAAATQTDLHAPLRDSVIRRDTAASVFDTLKTFRWHDPWVRIEGCIFHDSVRCRVSSVDTLRQVIHRIPRRFLFIRWGTKALRQEIVSSNPHTRIVYAEYIRIER